MRTTCVLLYFSFDQFSEFFPRTHKTTVLNGGKRMKEAKKKIKIDFEFRSLCKTRKAHFKFVLRPTKVEKGEQQRRTQTRNE